MRECMGEEEKTNEDCVEVVWEKRRIMEKRWCARSKIPDGVEGIRFLLCFLFLRYLFTVGKAGNI